MKLLTKSLKEYTNFSKYKNNTYKFGIDSMNIYDNIKKWFLRKNMIISKKKQEHTETLSDDESIEQVNQNSFLKLLNEFNDVIINKKIPELTEIPEKKKKIVGRGRKSLNMEKWYICDVCPRKFKTGAALGGNINN